METIETAVKSCITLILSNEHGAHWFEKKEFFAEIQDHTTFLKVINLNIVNASKNRRDIFINHYYTKYTSPKHPPSWMILESLTMGAISKLFQSLKRAQRKKIAKHFGVDEILLVSWLHILTYIRNLCAHHSRLWDRKLIIKPKVAKKFQQQLTDNRSFYAVTLIISVLQKNIGINNEWSYKLASLFNKYKEVIDLEKMGFPNDWNDFI